MTTALHRERFAAVFRVLRESHARRVLDLGCGDGAFTLALTAEPGIEAIQGLDLDAASLMALRAALADLPAAAAAKVRLRHASYLEPDPSLRGFDAAVMIETIEHIDPGRLSLVERAVFATIRPSLVIVTTPNADFNPLLGVPAHRRRHPDHRFEWGRERFGRWAEGVARRQGYTVACDDLGGHAPGHGGPSQMAVFRPADATTLASPDAATLA